jgi:hypothetical protein
MQVTGGIGMHRDIGPGQQQRRKLVTDNHHQRNQQDADRVHQNFFVHLSVPNLAAKRDSAFSFIRRERN